MATIRLLEPDGPPVPHRLRYRVKSRETVENLPCQHPQLEQGAASWRDLWCPDCRTPLSVKSAVEKIWRYLASSQALSREL